MAKPALAASPLKILLSHRPPLGEALRLNLPLLLALICIISTWAISASSQQPDESAVIRTVDAAVRGRLDGIAAYTATEHYTVFRNTDQLHPAAEMKVRTDYRRETGKTYTVLSESGSEAIRKFVMHAILDRERQINEPGTREHALITSANYEMKLVQGGVQHLDGRPCFVLSIHPRQKAPNLIDGTIWVDRRDGTLVQIQGTASKTVSFFVGPAQVLREYANMEGYSMATHARAVSNSFLLGTTIITIDYTDYKIDLAYAK